MFRSKVSGWLGAPLLGSVLLFSFSGCAQKPRPPAFSLYGYKGIAFLPFANKTHDPELAPAVTDTLAGAVANLGAVPVVEGTQVSAFLGQDAPAGASDANLRAKVSGRFKSDILMSGEVDDFEEILRDNEPERRVDKAGNGEWGYNTYRKSQVHFTIKILDAATGNLLWSQGAQGYSYKNVWTPLPIPGDITIPGDLEMIFKTAKRKIERDERDSTAGSPPPLRYKGSKAFANLRQQAIQEAVGAITADFRGQGGWTPGLKGNE